MTRNRWLRGVAAVGVVAAVAGCGATPGQQNGNKQAADTPAKVQTGGFQKLGPIKLRLVSADAPGAPQKALKSLIQGFETKYPNVSVKVSFRDYSSWIKQIKLALSTNDPPDIVEGAQGYQVDGTLVKAGLIRPLDPYAKVYGWDHDFSPSEQQELRWSDNGHTFGTGSLWGVAQSGQSTGVFANLAKLRAAGVDPASLKTFGDFEAALAKLRRALPRSEPVIMIGNSAQDVLVQVWGMIQGEYTRAQDVRNWIFHRPGATIDTAGNLAALQRLKAWADAGYFGNAGDYNSRNEEDAVALFARGSGAFQLGGNWNASLISDGLGKNAAFLDMPPGPSGKHAALGALSLPLHISSKCKHPEVAAALINTLVGPSAAKALVDSQQVPAVTDANAQASDPLARQVVDGWNNLVRDGGLLLFPDWASPTMLQTMGQAFQRMAVGQITPKDVIDRMHQDWAAYDQQLRGS